MSTFTSKPYSPNFSGGCLSTAIHMEKHNIEATLGAASTFRLFFRMLNQLPHVFLYDRYAIEEFDEVIVGGDVAISLISALQLCRSGKRVLLYRSEPDDTHESIKLLFRMRFSFFHEDVSRFLESKIGVRFDSSGFENFLDSICERIREAEEEFGGEVLICDGFCLNSDNLKTSIDGNKRKCFWVNENIAEERSSMWQIPYRKINRMIMPKIIKRSGKRDLVNRAIIKSKNTILTSYTNKEFYDDDGFIKIGNSSMMIAEIKSFDLSHRMLDFIGATMVSDLIKDKNKNKKYQETWQ